MPHMAGKPKQLRRSSTRLAAGLLLACGVGGTSYGGFVAWQITREFERRGWDIPAQVYAAPLEIYTGKRLSADNLQIELDRLGYRRSTASVDRPASYRRTAETIDVWIRAAARANGLQTGKRVSIQFADSRVVRILTNDNELVPILEFDPLLIGSIFPEHGEDRVVLTPAETPALLGEALKSVEDRRFDEHLGIDVRAIARAGLVNLREGKIQQGGSTLTQQLVRSYFLSTERTWPRKLKEAFMAITLELQHDKDELLQAYINEVYLAQDGSRAIHGFGLGSRFFFGKPLAELQLHELALLVALVRGPSYYDPRRHPDRARARRNLVLELIRDRGLIDDTAYAEAAAADLGIVSGDSGRSSYYAGFLDLVRRQLRRDYPAEQLQAKGLKVFTTLDPATQATAEIALTRELIQLQGGRAALEGALVITSPHDAEVEALIGGRLTGFDGFNRALDARRQIGSLIKPAIYLAALEQDAQTMISFVDDRPIDVPLENGAVWSPKNFDEKYHGSVTAARALAESLNVATVQLGLAVGTEAVADTLQKLGLERRPHTFPSLLLGAIDLSPFEVAQVFNTLANGGFRMPLRAVRAVTDADGRPLQRYRIEIEQVSDPAAVYALNRVLVEVMRRGTGRGAQQRLPVGLTTAGKTGTSDDQRDSWFAGFSGDHLIVTWVGNDANEVIGLTGSSGAARIWSRTLAQLDARPYDPPTPTSMRDVWIDYQTGLRTEPSCADAILLALPAAQSPPRATACGSARTTLGSRLRRWLRRAPDRADP